MLLRTKTYTLFLFEWKGDPWCRVADKRRKVCVTWPRRTPTVQTQPQTAHNKHSPGIKRFWRRGPRPRRKKSSLWPYSLNCLPSAHQSPRLPAKWPSTRPLKMYQSRREFKDFQCLTSMRARGARHIYDSSFIEKQFHIIIDAFGSFFLPLLCSNRSAGSLYLCTETAMHHTKNSGSLHPPKKKKKSASGSVMRLPGWSLLLDRYRQGVSWYPRYQTSQQKRSSVRS